MFEVAKFVLISTMFIYLGIIMLMSLVIFGLFIFAVPLVLLLGVLIGMLFFGLTLQKRKWLQYVGILAGSIIIAMVAGGAMFYSFAVDEIVNEEAKLQVKCFDGEDQSPECVEYREQEQEKLKQPYVRPE